MHQKLRRARELHREGGFPEVARGIRDYLSSNGDYEEKRTDNEDRWEYILPYISDRKSVCDIGCAEGFFTVRAASEGLFALGIDNREERIERAVQRADGLEGCAFTKWNLTPENVENLPTFESMFLLTVHHHWEDQYGLENAERMFQVVMDRCNLLIYEPPGDRPLIKNERRTLKPEEGREFYIDRLKSLYGDSIKILEVQMTDRTNRDPDREIMTERYDPVFAIDTSDYEQDMCTPDVATVQDELTSR